jgi:hypothetical protein
METYPLPETLCSLEHETTYKAQKLRYLEWYTPSSETFRIDLFVLFAIPNDKVMSRDIGYGLGDRGVGVRVPAGSNSASSAMDAGDSFAG